MDASDHKEFRSAALANSQIGETMIKLAKQANFEHPSKRPIRHGYMATVIKIANAFQRHNDEDDVQSYLTGLGSEWTEFVDGELKRSNEKNNRVIGS